MTNETKRALEIIRPMAEVLDIGVEADDRFLYCNGQAIGIRWNSTFCTVKEFLAYAFHEMCGEDYRYKKPYHRAMDLQQAIRRTWFTQYQVEVMNGPQAAEEGEEE